MRGSCATRGVIAAAGTVVALSAVTFGPSHARADEQQNRAARGLDSQLYLYGFGGYTGTGVSVGVHEAGNNIPNYFNNGALEAGSLLPLGNSFLPNARFSILPQGGVRGPADTVGNHASTVAGVVVASHAQHYGIARTGNILAAGFDIPDLGTFEDSDRAGAARAIANTQGMALQGTRIINQSWGFIQASINPNPPPSFHNPFNDGSSLNSRFTDWAVLSNPGSSIRDLLIVVAGNEGDPGEQLDWGSPSDAFNVLNVGATGRINGAGNLSYDAAAQYNLSNETSDISPITLRGRMNTHMVAPGGDPDGPIGPLGTVATPGGSGQFFGTSGGQVQVIRDENGDPVLYDDSFNPADPRNGSFFYTSDDRAGVLGLVGTGLVNNAGVTWDNDLAGPTVTPGVDNPGIGLRGVIPQYTLSNDDAHQTFGTAGTSFAAPLVSGAAANLVQYGNANGENTDHRVLKAILMNGASKTSEETGLRLMRKDLTAWTRVISESDGFEKGDVIRGGTVPIQVGLDEDLGTGQLDMLGSFINYAGGQQGPGVVADTGYDLDTVAAGHVNTYEFTTYGGEFRATLVWDRMVVLNDTNGNGQWDFEDDNGDDILDPTEAEERFTLSDLTDLDLELYYLDPILGEILVDFSTSDIDNTEHIWLEFLPAGTYALDVLCQDLVGQEYGLAWMIPAPSTLALLGLAGGLMARRRRAQS